MSKGRDTPVRYGPTLVVGLIGAVAVTVGVTKPWATATAHQAGLPEIQAQVSGADLAPLSGALGVVILAAFGAVVATRGWVRRVLGVVIMVAAAVVLVSTIDPPGATSALREGLSAKGWSGGDYTTSTAGWRWVCLGGAVLCIAAGLAISLYGARWATMGRQYDAPAGGEPASVESGGSTSADAGDESLTGADVWREIDQGRDPTHRDPA